MAHVGHMGAQGLGFQGRGLGFGAQCGLYGPVPCCVCTTTLLFGDPGFALRDLGDDLVGEIHLRHAVEVHPEWWRPRAELAQLLMDCLQFYINLCGPRPEGGG